MEIINAANSLSGFITKEGLKFIFDEDEEILVDSFVFQSGGKLLAYTGFITNKKFIFKKAKYNQNKHQRNNSPFHSEICYINWNDIDSIYFGKQGVNDGTILFNGKDEKCVREFTPDGKTKPWEAGFIDVGYGAIGNLSYNGKKDKKKLFLDVLTSINDICKENNIPFGTSDKYKDFATVDKESGLKIKSYIEKKQREGAGLVLGCLLTFVIGFIILVVIAANSG